MKRFFRYYVNCNGLRIHDGWFPACQEDDVQHAIKWDYSAGHQFQSRHVNGALTHFSAVRPTTHAGDVKSLI